MFNIFGWLLGGMKRIGWKVWAGIGAIIVCLGLAYGAYTLISANASLKQENQTLVEQRDQARTDLAVSISKYVEREKQIDYTIDQMRSDRLNADRKLTNLKKQLEDVQDEKSKECLATDVGNDVFNSLLDAQPRKK